jgi:glycosyltransferase involved in cell wall biosynthesis
MDIYYDGLIYCLQERGGVSRYFTKIIEQLASKQNTEVILPAPHRAQIPQNAKIKRTFVPFSSSFKQLKILNEKRYLDYISYLKTGLLHSSYYQTYPSISIPVVVTVYDLIYEQFPDDFNTPNEQTFVEQKKLAITSADAVICISETIKKQVIDYYGVNKQSVFATPLGVDSGFNSQPLHDIHSEYILPKPYLLYVGKRGKYKNFMMLLRTFTNKAIHKEYDLVCIGGERVTPQESSLISKHNLQNKVHFLTNINNQTLANFYKQAGAYVSPSLAEGFGLPVLEAMACGCPVILSDIEVYHEVAGDAGIYFDPTKAASLRKLLTTFRRNHKKINQGVTTAQELSWEKTAKKTLEVYKSIL